MPIVPMNTPDDSVSPGGLAEAPVDFELESSSGGSRRLASLRGRVVVIFWEDRERHRANLALKRALSALDAPGLCLIAVGDVKDYDFEPVRAIVRVALSALARAIGVEILLDWRGTLAAAPFSLTPGAPNVLVIDPEGRPVLRARGELAPMAQREVLETVRAELARLPRAAA